MAREWSAEPTGSLRYYLSGVLYPADRAQLLERAQRNGAPEEIVRMIERFDADEYGGPQDVERACGQLH